MKKIYLLLVSTILLIVINSCTKEDDNEVQITNTDLSVFSTSDEILYLNESNRTEQINNSLVFNYGNVTPQDVDIIYDYNSDFTNVNVTIQLKSNINNFNDPNLDNNTVLINLIDFRNSGLDPNNSNYNNIPISGMAGNTNLPNHFSLDMPPAGHQGSSGSCVGWAVAYGMQGFYRKNEFNLQYLVNGSLNENSVGSPSYIYNQIDINCNGSQTTNAFDILENQGTCTIAEMPFTSDCSTDPNAFQISVAEENKITSYEGVSITVNAVKSQLFENRPVVIGTFITPGYSNTETIEGIEVWNDSSGNTNDLGHAMVVSGWNDSINAFKMLNSYGTSINNGYVWMDYSVFTDLVYEAYVGYNDSSSQNGSSEIVLSNDLNFNNTQINTTSSQISFTITNSGDEDFNVTSITSSNDNIFNIVNPQTGVITPTDEMTIYVTFNPTQVKSYDGTITIENNADNGNSTISLTGAGIDNNSGSSTIQITPNNINFNDTQINTTSSQMSFTITNSGDADFNVTNITSSNNVFSIVNGQTGVITPNNDMTIYLTFNPTQVQNYNETITVGNNADNGSGTVALSGTGIDNNNTGNSDLKIEDIWFDEESNGNWEINTRVKNVGNESTPNNEVINIRYYVNGNEVGSDEASYPLGVNQDDTEYLNDYEFPYNGNHNVEVVVEQVSNEVITSNNSMTISFDNSTSGGLPQVYAQYSPRDNCSSTDSSDNYRLDLNTIYYRDNWNIDNILSYGSDDKRGMWYRFRTTDEGSYKINLTMNGDPGFELFTVCGASSVATKDSSSGNSETETYTISANSDIYIRFYDNNDNSNIDFDISIEH
jgi:hypothetical protein